MGKRTRTKPSFEYVHWSELDFDPDNPRFPSTSAGRSSQEAIQKELENEPHLALELVESFLENGFIDYEPLVVRRAGTRLVVVEGNRRLAAIRHIQSNRVELAKRSKALPDLESIPVLVFPDASDEQSSREQRVYLGVRHLFGFREWPAESKARYLDSQIKSEVDLPRVMRELNIKRQDIQRYVVPYRIRKAAKDLWKPHADQDFWVLGEGLSRAGIKDYLELELNAQSLEVKSFKKPKLGFLLKFIYGTPAKERADRLIKDTRELSTLAGLLKHRKAAAALEKGKSLPEASVLVESVTDARKRLKSILRDCKALLARFRDKPEAASTSKAFQVFEKAAREFLKNG